MLETQRKSEKAKADAELTETQTKLNMGINLANIQATRQAEVKDAELQREVETKRAEMELERLRGRDLVNAKISRESAQQRADAQFYTDNKTADALLYKQQQDAEASFQTTVKGAEASFQTTVKGADAAFYAAKKEAEGIAEKAKAYESMAAVLGGPQGLLQYMMLQSNTYEKLAKANAQAINGLQPKITVWNTGDQAGGEDMGRPIRNILQSLPPLLSTINEQTGIAPPSWLAQMGVGNSQALTPTGKRKSGMGLTNGDAGVDGGK